MTCYQLTLHSFILDMAPCHLTIYLLLGYRQNPSDQSMR